MARRKLKRFAENRSNPHLIEPEKDFFEHDAGHWHEQFFQNTNPIHLELACGRGEYSLGMGRLFAEQNFIGVDVKGDRLWKGASAAQEEKLQNVGFLRSRMHEIDKHFATNEVESIKVVFPDPRPRTRDIRRRLTHTRYLEMYRQILKPEGWFMLKTDSPMFFDFTLEELEKIGCNNLALTRDLYASPMLSEHYGIQTRYEKMWLEEKRKIHYLKCRFVEAERTKSAV